MTDFRIRSAILRDRGVYAERRAKKEVAHLWAHTVWACKKCGKRMRGDDTKCGHEGQGIFQVVQFRGKNWRERRDRFANGESIEATKGIERYKEKSA